MEDSERPLRCSSLCVTPFIYLLKGEYSLKNDDTFSGNGAPPTTSAHEQDRNSDGSTLSSPPRVPQDAPASTDPPLMGRRLTPRHRVRLLLVAMLVLVVLG